MEQNEVFEEPVPEHRMKLAKELLGINADMRTVWLATHMMQLSAALEQDALQHRPMAPPERFIYVYQACQDMIEFIDAHKER